MSEALIALREGLDRIMSTGAADMDRQTYIRLYTLVHDHCVSCKKNNHTNDQTNGRRHRGAHLMGEELYRFLDDYLKQHLRSVHAIIIDQAPDEILDLYTEQWSRYVAAAKYNEHLFRFLERHWVRRELDEGKSGILEIYPLHLARWKELIIENEDVPVIDVLKVELEKDKAGVEAASIRIEQVTESLAALGIGGPGLHRQTSSDSLNSWCIVDDAGQLSEFDGVTNGGS
jgi:cullin 1